MKTKNHHTSKGGACATETPTINQKPDILRSNARTVLNDKSRKFSEKRLCDGITLNPGDPCLYGCAFCYVEILVDRCKHVWAEVIDLRGKSLVSTLASLQSAGFNEQAEALSSVMGLGRKEAREHCARATFLAHTRHILPAKLRFLQYVDGSSVEWWAGWRRRGAVLLGKAAEERSRPSFPANEKTEGRDWQELPIPPNGRHKAFYCIDSPHPRPLNFDSYNKLQHPILHARPMHHHRPKRSLGENRDFHRRTL